VHNELGIIYRKAGRFAEAKKSYEAALAVYPGYHYARRNLAVLCDLYLADLTCALENYEAYMATVPSDKQASMWISDIRNRIGQ
jgi:Flp pilus assembly protein TadD